MSTLQDHADAGLNLLRADSQLTVYDGKVDDGAPDHYVVVHTFRGRPGALEAPDKIPLTGASVAVDIRLYCVCVGATARAMRAVQARVEARLLDVTPVVANRDCSPIRLKDGAQDQREEDTLDAVFSTTDVYGWTSVPG